MKIDIHTHSCYSDGVNTPKEMIDYAKSIGLNGIAITDHNEIKGSMIAMKYNSDDFRVIPGIEVSSTDGHILCLGVTELIKERIPAREVIDAAHDLGGIAIAAHPYDRFRQGVGDLIYELDFDAIEIRNGHTISTTRDMKKIAESTDLPKTGGSDAHSLSGIGSVSIIVENDPIDSILRGEIEIIVNTNKPRLVMDYVRRKISNFF